MKLSLKIDVAGVEQLNHHLGELITALHDFREPLEMIGAMVAFSTAKNFIDEGRPTKWKELSTTVPKGRKESYATWKARKFPGRKILERTGALRGSLQIDGAGNVFTVTNTQLTYGSDLSVGSWNLGLLHQKLSDYTAEGMVVAQESGKGPPQRKIINLQRDEKNNIVQTLRKYLVKHGGLEP